MELDHVILFVPGPEAAAGLVPGCVLDPGRRHDGQGTRNRRVHFARTYVEVLWIEDPAQERRTGLGFAARCASGTACPFGAVLRGRVSDDARARFVPYQVPGGGPALLLLAAARDDPDQPFVAVRESGDPPSHPDDLLRHPCGARGIRRVTYRSRTVPDLGSSTPRDVAFETGQTRLRLEVDGLVEPRPWEFDATGQRVTG